MKYAFSFASGLALWLSLLGPATKADASPVLLSFDVEEQADDQLLRKIDIKVPATYFVTGEFAKEHPDAVAELAKGSNTVGSHSYDHPHFTSLRPDEITSQLTRSKQLLESITRKPVRWFRAPYLDYDDRVMQALHDCGFIGDSSDKDSWAKQSTVFELPISNFLDSSLIASDYDMLTEARFSRKQYTEALERMYREKDASDQPLIILMHPSVSSQQIDAVHDFIGFVRKSGGRFVSADTYLNEWKAERPRRRALWIGAKEEARPAAEIAAEAKSLGATDVFLMATDAKGNRYFGMSQGTDRFGTTAALLRARGIRVHAWISALADEKAVAQHPSWAMTAKDGTRSTSWMSPANPEVADYVRQTIQQLVRDYHVNGISLDNLAYPSAEFDYAPEIVQAFAQHEKLNHAPKLDELVNEYYTEWCTWRSLLISRFAGDVGNEFRKSGNRIELSAIVQVNAAINFREHETSGQNVGLLADNIDLVVADVPLSAKSGEQEPLLLQVFAQHLRSGSRHVMARLHDGAEPVSAAVVGKTAGRLTRGIDGIGFIADRYEAGTEKPKQAFSASRR